MRSQAHDCKFLGALLISTDQEDNLLVWSSLGQFLKVARSSAAHSLSKCVVILYSIDILVVSFLPSLYFSPMSFIFFWFALFIFEKRHTRV